MGLGEEISKRRTFGIISHPDAGKTTLTEKLLLFGGAIQVAGAVKSNKIKRGATSDFMEIERQRGISVATSVMAFNYEGRKINILDLPFLPISEHFARSTRTQSHWLASLQTRHQHQGGHRRPCLSPRPQAFGGKKRGLGRGIFDQRE